MKVKLLIGVRYPADWVFNGPAYEADVVVPVVPATNQPNWLEEGKVWINTPELEGDAYGILLRKGEYQEVKDEQVS